MSAPIESIHATPCHPGSDWMRAFVETHPHGALHLDSTGRVLHLNASADAMLFGSGLASHTDGVLQFVEAKSQQAFAIALGEAARGANAIVVVRENGASVLPDLLLRLSVLPDENHHTHLLMTVTPLSSRFAVASPARRNGNDETSPLSLLCTALGLSPAQARVVLALREHHDTSRAAAALGLRPWTVRSHLRNLHARLHLDTNSELILLAERVLSSAP